MRCSPPPGAHHLRWDAARARQVKKPINRPHVTVCNGRAYVTVARESQVPSGAHTPPTYRRQGPTRREGGRKGTDTDIHSINTHARTHARTHTRTHAQKPTYGNHLRGDAAHVLLYTDLQLEE